MKKRKAAGRKTAARKAPKKSTAKPRASTRKTATRKKPVASTLPKVRKLSSRTLSRKAPVTKEVAETIQALTAKVSEKLGTIKKKVVRALKPGKSVVLEAADISVQLAAALPPVGNALARLKVLKPGSPKPRATAPVESEKPSPPINAPERKPEKVESRDTGGASVPASHPERNPEKPKPREIPAARPSPQPPQLPFRIPPILFEGDDPATKREKPVPVGFGSRPSSYRTGDNLVPSQQSESRLWLTPRDPHTLYVHWHIHQQQLESSAPALILRIYGPHPGAPPISEISIAPNARYVFAQVPHPANTYYAELGCYSPDWVALAVSGSCTTPPESATVHPATEFATLAPIHPVEARPSGHHGHEAPVSARPIPGFEQPARHEIEWNDELEASLAELIAAQLIDRSEALDSELLQRQILKTLSSLKSVRRIHRLLVPFVSGISDSISSLELQEHFFPTSPGGLEALSSEMAPSATGRPFWFMVNAELIVYGATEPGATVTIGGKPIALRPDGSFSFRFALPDGTYQIPASAQSAHGDVRHANLQFKRKTSHVGEVGIHPQDKSLKVPAPENVS